jgi:hypothetical protein
LTRLNFCGEAKVGLYPKSDPCIPQQKVIGLSDWFEDPVSVAVIGCNFPQTRYETSFDDLLNLEIPVFLTFFLL